MTGLKSSSGSRYSVKAKIYFKRFNVEEEYQVADFGYKEYPVESFLMNKVFKVTTEKDYLLLCLSSRQPVNFNTSLK